MLGLGQWSIASPPIANAAQRPWSISLEPSRLEPTQNATSMSCPPPTVLTKWPQSDALLRRFAGTSPLDNGLWPVAAVAPSRLPSPDHGSDFRFRVSISIRHTDILHIDLLLSDHDLASPSACPARAPMYVMHYVGHKGVCSDTRQLQQLT